MNLPIGLGDESRQDYFHAVNYDITMHQLGETPDGFKGGEVKLNLPWDADALQNLMTIPPGIREMVTEQTETFAREHGDEKVTQARFQQLAEEAGMSDDFFDRFRKKKAG